MPKCQNAKIPNTQYPISNIHIPYQYPYQYQHPIPSHPKAYSATPTTLYYCMYLTLSYLTAYFNLWFIIMYGRSRYHETIGWWEREKGVADALDVLDSLELGSVAASSPQASGCQVLDPLPLSLQHPPHHIHHSSDSFIRFIRFIR